MHLENDRISFVNTFREELRTKELSEFAKLYGVTIKKGRNINKGWVGITLSKIANEIQNRNANSESIYYMKSVKVKMNKGSIEPLETMALTKLDPRIILTQNFEDSDLWNTIKRLLLIGCEYHNKEEAKIIKIQPFNIDDISLKNEIRALWESIKAITANGEISSYSCINEKKNYIQLRRKGTKNSKSSCPITGNLFHSKSFYAKKDFLRYCLGSA